MDERRICRRCLTRDIADQEMIFQNLQEYIKNLDRDIRAEDGLYESRLSVCLSCDRLLQGMCRVCGCYVELRAAVAARSCPMDQW
ncbi:MAG: hypothetical protein HDR26_06190 [Lachnospiraceae bacterium]|nr:hypothetical protein [Lachnospiraceae bacterium]